MQRAISILTLITTVALFGACGDDNPAATGGNASVEGTVTFLNTGSWPAAGDVQVSIYSVLPSDLVPAGPPDAFTNPITSGTSEYAYKLSGLDEGQYVAIYVSWRDPAVPGSATLLGMYWACCVNEVGVAFNGSKVAPKDPGPTHVNLSGSNLHPKNLNITADLALVP